MPLPAPSRPTCTHFYKYSKPDHLERLQPIILEHTLYLPDRTELNDDIDCLPHLSLQSDDEMVLFLLQRFVRDDPSISLAVLDDHERVLRFNIYKNGAATYHPLMVELSDAQLAPFRIYSMTKRPDRMNFWAHYAANHTGYCLEFLHQGPLFKSAREVSYLPADQMFIPITDPSISNGDFFFCKTLDWSNEEEVRLVTHRHQGPRVKMNDPRWLNRIILGKDMEEPHRKQIREWAVRRDPVLPVANAYLDLAARTIQLKPA